MDSMTASDSAIFSKMIMSILDSWGLNARQQHSLLALSKKIPTRALRRYREDTAFPDDPAVTERLEHIVGIVQALQTTYPHNPSMGSLWMKQANRRFSNKAPIEIMLVEGLDGVLRIRAHLDCTFDWQINS